jgi:hypothetical protein
MPKSYPTKLPGSFPVPRLEALLKRIGGIIHREGRHCNCRLPIGAVVPYRHDREMRRDELSNFLRQAGIACEEFFRLVAGEKLMPKKWALPDDQPRSAPRKRAAKAPAPDA